MSYERKLVQGIPVYVKDGAAHTWDQEQQIRFGTVTDDNRLIFDEGWSDALQPHLDAWRATLHSRNRAELRNVRKNIGAKST